MNQISDPNLIDALFENFVMMSISEDHSTTTLFHAILCQIIQQLRYNIAVYFYEKAQHTSCISFESLLL